MKTCTKCNQNKSLDQFTKVNSYSDKLRSNCKECRRQEQLEYRHNNPRQTIAFTRKWQKGNPEKTALSRRKCQLKRQFGLTLSEYNELLNIQDGVCSICKEKCSSGRSLAVDHNHMTGDNRGLLCMNCNQGLGKFKDNKDLLIEASKYLEFYETDKRSRSSTD